MSRRRWIIGALALAVLLLWQRSATTPSTSVLAEWWYAWSASWQMPLWNVAFLATLLAAGLFLSPARQLLREYLSTRFSMRAMLGATAVAASAALLFFGPAGPPLVALYTLGTVLYEALGRPISGRSGNGLDDPRIDNGAAFPVT
jgi:succinate dehydrogenase hydrophobic anchor subunit